jgi:hypothetical protein
MHVGGLPCSLRGCNREPNLLGLLLQVERQERAARLFLAHHLTNPIRGLGGVLQIQYQIRPLMAEQGIARQLGDLAFAAIIDPADQPGVPAAAQSFRSRI